jgi:hypothetical protein
MSGPAFPDFGQIKSRAPLVRFGIHDSFEGSMLKHIQAVGQSLFPRVEAGINVLFGDRLNPLCHLGRHQLPDVLDRGRQRPFVARPVA